MSALQLICLVKCKNQADQYAKENGEKDGTRINAEKHALWNALMTYSLGLDLASKIATAHEEELVYLGVSKDLHVGISNEMHMYMDELNNAIGRQIAMDNPSVATCEELIDIIQGTALYYFVWNDQSGAYVLDFGL